MNVQSAIEKNPKQKRKIESLGNRAKMNEALLEVADNIGMKQLINISIEQVIGIDSQLMNDGIWENQGNKRVKVRLEPLDRAEMVGKRDALVSLIESFPHAKESLEHIKKKISRYESR